MLHKININLYKTVFIINFPPVGRTDPSYLLKKSNKKNSYSHLIKTPSNQNKLKADHSFNPAS